MSQTLDLIELSGVPRVHLKSKLELIPNTCRHKITISNYLSHIRENVNNGKGLYLYGNYGSGKSSIAALCVFEAAKHKLVSFWVKAKNLPDIRISGRFFDEYTTLYERCLEVPLLVMDEFQLRKEIRYTEELFEDVLRERVDRRKATIVSSNVTLSILREAYPALYSVMQECLLPVKITGVDFRKSFQGDPTKEVRPCS